MVRRCPGRRKPQAILRCLFLAGLAATLLATGHAQEPKDLARLDEVLLPPPRALAQRVMHAREMLSQGRPAEAVSQLQAVLAAGPGDGFLPPEGPDDAAQPLRQKVRGMLNRLPAPAREWSNLQFGPLAVALVRDAATAQDREALSRAAGIYLHTRAGQDAALLLAYDGLDRGRPLQALLWLARVEQAASRDDPRRMEVALLQALAWLALGRDDAARQALLPLQKDWRRARVRIADQEISLDDPERLWAQLRNTARPTRRSGRASNVDWLTFRGGPERNEIAAAPPGSPTQAWYIPSAESPDDEFSIRAMVTRTEPGIRLPVGQPLVAGRTVLARLPQRLVAIDLPTGRRTWEYPWGAEEEPHAAIPSNMRKRVIVGSHLVPDRRGQLRSRLLDDAVYGQISSDGRRVFLVDGLAVPSPVPLSFLPSSMRTARDGGRLLALDLRKEGAIAWSIGDEESGDGPLARASFLGPPAVDGNRLYALFEREGEIALAVVAAETGHVEWTQGIVQPATPLGSDRPRRLGGCAASVSDGIILCPTSAGAIVAVDALSRELLWGFAYAREKENSPRPLGVMAFRPTYSLRSTWIDSSVTVASGRVLVTPIDSDYLYCLDLLSGAELWSASRGEGLYLACAHQDKAIVVGEGEVTALRLDNRRPAWSPRSVQFPDGAKTAGRGVYDGRNYWLPVTGRKLLQIVLADGQIVVHPTPEPLGNLVSTPAGLFSQSAEGIRCLKKSDL